ncbi:PKD domain-containing protein [Candidatus Woesearchaeota archaeon]|nr:PKD domain-containing protein [Candidatus Woesearchaeota archaeon]MBT4712306.1 PKD domain-containing protein [Candidatus Woesearchaeota archaeon]MBT6638854.1 PKD domain-containing protein [Candidatus Woesearchaeota archaeon]MBT7496727.1 PKD domain-containing protein [Candidatus Woesearchaeota archaeon]
MKKGSISISTTLIVVLIIAIIMIGLTLFFIRDRTDDASQQVERYSSTVQTQVTITSPVHNSIAYSGNEVFFEAQTDSSVTNYFWYVDGDEIPDHTGSSFSYIYQEPGDYEIELKAVGPAGTDEKSILLHVYSKNLKNMNKYSQNPIFLTPATSSRGIAWENLHKIIPLAVWSEDNSLTHYPLRAYNFKSVPSATELTNLMKGNSFGYITETNKVSAGLREHLNPQDQNAYFDFWTAISSVVVIDPDNEDDALLAALFAAYSNSPLLFLDNTNYNGYKPIMTGKKIYWVGSLDTNLQNFVISQQNTHYSNAQLKSTTNNRIVDLNARVS